MNTQPRQQHYLFAHHLLRSEFFRDPAHCFRALELRGLDYLHELWDRASMVDQESGALAELPPEGIDYEIRDLPDNVMVALVTLPPADALTEAYFVALVYQPYSVFPRPSGAAMARYLTLEYGVDFVYLAPRPSFCEWRADRCHVSHGSGPDAEIEQFFLRVVDMIGGNRN